MRPAAQGDRLRCSSICIRPRVGYWASLGARRVALVSLLKSEWRNGALTRVQTLPGWCPGQRFERSRWAGRLPCSLLSQLCGRGLSFSTGRRPRGNLLSRTWVYSDCRKPSLAWVLGQESAERHFQGVEKWADVIEVEGIVGALPNSTPQEVGGGGEIHNGSIAPPVDLEILVRQPSAWTMIGVGLKKVALTTL